MKVLSKEFGLEVANVFHAGDGNLHPLILYNANAPGELEKAEDLGAEILKLCVDVGGVLTGEHGVGVHKMDFLIAEHGDAISVMRTLKMALDPDNIMNPGKVL